MRVALFTLGGTIAMSGDRGGGVVARLDGADLTDGVPGLARTGIDLDIHDAVPVPSARLTFAGMVEVIAAASAAVSAGADGVVVTQGTDTLEETAYLADLLWPHDAPFVVTGAMRNPTLAGPDGPANLLAAVVVAASRSATGLGAVVVFNDEIHLARTVRKTHTTSTATFASPDLGPIGHVVEGEVRLLARPATRPAPITMPPRGALDAATVPLHVCTLDDDATLIRDLDENPRVAGLVVAGFGVGHVPPWLVDPLTALAARIPVVLTSRAGAGSVLRDTYGAPGGERDLLARGLIYGGFLHPFKARILLRTLLATGATRDAVAGAFQERA